MVFERPAPFGALHGSQAPSLLPLPRSPSEARTYKTCAGRVTTRRPDIGPRRNADCAQTDSTFGSAPPPQVTDIGKTAEVCRTSARNGQPDWMSQIAKQPLYQGDSPAAGSGSQTSLPSTFRCFELRNEYLRFSMASW
jgi:hypothetical protein